MVAFSRITFALAIAGLSGAQSFPGPAPSGDLPSAAFPSGAARPTGGLHGGPGDNKSHHGPGRHSSGFAHPTGSFHPDGPRPTGTGVFDAQRVQQTGAPYPSGGDSSPFPSGAAKPSGYHGHRGKSGKKGGKGKNHGGQPSGSTPTAAPSTPSGLERRQQASRTHHAPGGFPAPSAGFPSGGFPEAGAPFPTGADFNGFPSGVARPSGHHGHRGKGGKSGKGEKGEESSGPAPTGFVTSTVRGA